MSIRSPLVSCALAVAALCAGTAPAWAATTEISNTPITSSRSAEVKPNIMLLMDTSQSMGYTHMPDEVEEVVKPTSVGYKSFQCNTLYYNPSTNYGLVRPKDADGAVFPAASFSAARYDVFDTAFTTTVDLGTGFQAYDNGGGAFGTATQSVRLPTWTANTPGAAYYYVYSGPQTLTYTSAACADTDSGATRTATGGGTWTRVVVTSASAEAQNFANWYQFYRTRMHLMKTAVSQSFSTLTEAQRVGFITVNPTASAASPLVEASKFLAINDFKAGAGLQREQWYAKLFAQKPTGTSPAREGLARVGRYYGNKFDGINQGMGGVDPMPYSCQQNFTILTTDGYWNAQAEKTPAVLGGSFLGGPVDLTGTALVGQQDGSLTDGSGNTPYGVWDGAANEYRTTTDRLNTYFDVPCVAAGATYVRRTQTQASVQRYTAETWQTTRTTQQYTRSSHYFSQAQHRYDESTVQYERRRENYTTQTLNFTLSTEQRTRTDVPFTTRTQVRYQLRRLQYQERTQSATYVDTPWTQKVTDQYLSQTVQWRKEVRAFEQQQYRYTFGRTQNWKRTFQWTQTDSENENGVLVSNCTPGPGVTCEKIPGAWAPVAAPCTSTVTPPTSSPYLWEECRTDVIQATGPVTTCTEGTILVPGPDMFNETCTKVVVQPVTPVSSCTPGTSQSPSSPYITTVCNDIQISPPTYADTGGGPCNNVTASSAPYHRTICSPGPLNSPNQGVSSCTVGGPTLGVNFSYTTCSRAGPTVSYVDPTTTCNNQAPAIGNSYISITCTPGTPTAATPIAVGCAAVSTVGTAGTASARRRVCTTTAFTAYAPVPQCTKGVGQTGVYNLAASPFTRYECQNNGPSQLPLSNSAPCTPGSEPAPVAGSWVYETCTRTPATGVTTNYVASAASCSAQTASSTNGGLTVTCTTPPPVGPYDVTTCSPGTQGSGASQLTRVCGSRPLTSNPVSSCMVGTSGSGAIITTCSLAVGPEVPVATCSPIGDTYNTTTPPYTGQRCNYSSVYDFLPVACTPGVTPEDPGNGYTRTTCTLRNATGPTTVAACGTIGTTVGIGPAYVHTTCTDTLLLADTPINADCTPGDSFDGSKTTTCTRHDTPATGVANCVPGAPRDTTSPYAYQTCTDVYAANPTTIVYDAATCAAQEQVKDPGNGYTSITCNTVHTGPSPSAPCVGTTNSGSPNFITTTCASTPATAYAPAACSVGTTYDPVTFDTTTCVENEIEASHLESCTPGPTAEANFVTKHCTTGAAPGLQRRYTTTETVTSGLYSNGFPVGPQPSATSTVGTFEWEPPGVCHVASINPLPALPTPSRPTTGMPGVCTEWPCVSSSPRTGGSINSLADVAQFYYVTDLRPDYPNTGADAVPHLGTGPLDDRAEHQHMTTFTIALGASGSLNYRSDYRTPAGDFAAILANTRGWPQWPDPLIDYVGIPFAVPGVKGPNMWEDPRSIDDFWHTAVNGRGIYFNANDPASVIAGVQGALLGIQGAVASGAAAGLVSQEPVAGANDAFVTTYVTRKWTGDVQSRSISLTNGTISSTINWSADALLQLRVGAACDSRNIYLMHPAGGTSLVDFSAGTRECDAGRLPTGPVRNGLTAAGISFASLGLDNSVMSALTQYPLMTNGGANDQRGIAGGANLVNFLRGQTGFEGFVPDNPNKLYRDREGALGDVIGAQPVYVKVPFAGYQDAGYAAFKAANASRLATVYVAANDGMLHAFQAEGVDAGKELWAVIPSAVTNKLFRLTDENYEALHEWYVDQTPTVGDAKHPVNGWKTILVGGLNAGGKGYYALDVTDPLNPVALWEFKASTTCYNPADVLTHGSDCNLGLSYGKPLITKLASDNSWVVMFTSGYNNVSPGDGKGYLYVVDAFTGKIKSRISTNDGTSATGDTTTPSNLGQITNFVDDAVGNNSTLRVYGGDMLGNIWRFDVNDTHPPAGLEATRIGVAKTSGGVVQPITTRIELAEVDGKPMIFVGTGRLLGPPDTTDTTTQSIYGIVDKLNGDPVYPDLRTALAPLQMTQLGSGAAATRDIACTGSAALCAATDGWFVDLPESGERVNVDMKLVLGTLVIASNVPATSACEVGGHSWFNYLEYRKGGKIPGAPNVGAFLSNSLVVGFNIIRLPDGTFGSAVRTSNAENKYPQPYIGVPLPGGNRISWREIPQQ